MKDKEKKERAIKLLKAMGVEERYKYIIENMASQYQLKGFEKVVMQIVNDNMDMLLGDTASTYAKHLSPEVIEDTINFYESKSGREYVKMGPTLESELASIGSSWTFQVLEAANKVWKEKSLKEQVEKGLNWSDYIPPINPH